MWPSGERAGWPTESAKSVSCSHCALTTGAGGCTHGRHRTMAIVLWRPWVHPPAPVVSAQWEQLTDFADSVGQPALSPDGHMLAFVRGPDTFVTPGQIYL